MSERIPDEWYGWWLCDDGDVFPTRQQALDHLEMVNYPETRGRLKRYSAEFEDQDPFEGEWETVQLGDAAKAKDSHAD